MTSQFGHVTTRRRLDSSLWSLYHGDSRFRLASYDLIRLDRRLYASDWVPLRNCRGRGKPTGYSAGQGQGKDFRPYKNPHPCRGLRVSGRFRPISEHEHRPVSIDWPWSSS